MEYFKLVGSSNAPSFFYRGIGWKNLNCIVCQTRIHNRKYVGIVLCLGNYHYYIPMSSPKETDYQIAGENKVIKKSIVPIIRIVVNIRRER